MQQSPCDGVTEVRLWLVNAATRYGSHDPEDIAHIVIERALRHGTPLTKHYGYWRRAAYNQVVTEARHAQIEGTHLAEYQATVKDSLPVQSNARLRRVCGIIGLGRLLWLARYGRGRNHTASERVKASRLRKRLKEGTCSQRNI